LAIPHGVEVPSLTGSYQGWIVLLNKKEQTGKENS